MMGKLLLPVLALTALAGPAPAQDYPTRPVRAIVAVGAGGTGDVITRVLGEELYRRWGQPVVVENRPGGASNIGARACADAPPDGYTLCILPGEPLAYQPVPLQEADLRSRQGFRAGQQSVLQYPGAGGQRRAQGAERGRARRLSKAKAGTLSYTAPSLPLALYLERLKREPAPIRPHPVPRRRRHHQRGAVGIDADRVLRHATSSPTAGRHQNGLAVDGGKRSPLFPDIPTLGSRLLRHLRPSISAGLRPPARPGAIIDKIPARTSPRSATTATSRSSSSIRAR